MRNRVFCLFRTPRHYSGVPWPFWKKFRGKRAPGSVTKRYRGSRTPTLPPRNLSLVLKWWYNVPLRNNISNLMFWRHPIWVWPLKSWYFWLWGVKNSQKSTFLGSSHPKFVREWVFGPFLPIITRFRTKGPLRTSIFKNHPLGWAKNRIFASTFFWIDKF